MTVSASFRALYREVLRPVTLALFSRLVCWPLTMMIPRTTDWIVVIGRENGKYVDNAKHFYANVLGSKLVGGRVSFVTSRPAVYQALVSEDADALFYPGWRSRWALLRARYIVVDSMDYIEQGRIGLVRGADIVQIWHGAPLKHIELSLHEARLERLSFAKQWIIRASKLVTGRYKKTALLVSTSAALTDRVFRSSMAAEAVVNSGYPRNDVLYDPGWINRPLIKLNVDVDAFERMSSHRLVGGKVIAYSPTFRGDPKGNQCALKLDLEKLTQFCDERNLICAIKPHPVMVLANDLVQHKSILMIEGNSDFYPLMREVDVLVTDYSSIYFDFLHLDRPIVFYPYDLEDYLNDDRPFYFDYDEVTPGRKAWNFGELLDAIDAELTSQNDQFALARKSVASMMFDHMDGRATERLTKEIARRLA